MSKFCMNCGSELPDIAKFCPKCGAACPTPTSTPAPAPRPAPARGIAPLVQSWYTRQGFSKHYREVQLTDDRLIYTDDGATKDISLDAISGHQIRAQCSLPMWGLLGYLVTPNLLLLLLLSSPLSELLPNPLLVAAMLLIPGVLCVCLWRYKFLHHCLSIRYRSDVLGIAMDDELVITDAGKENLDQVQLALTQRVAVYPHPNETAPAAGKAVLGFLIGGALAVGVMALIDWLPLQLLLG